MNSEIRKILNANRAQKTFFTHTSMITPKGIFSFPHNKLDNFWEVYCGLIFKDPNAIIGLNEVPQQFMPVIGDIDIKVEISKLTELKLSHIPDSTQIKPGQNIYSEEQLRQTVKTYQMALKKTVTNISDRELTCVVLEKPSYVKSYSKAQYLSNGFHIHFPYVFLDKNDIQIFIMPLIQSCLEKLKLFDNILPDNSAKAVDEGIFNNPWLIYGGRKNSDSQPYRVTKIYDFQTKNITLEQAFEEYKIFDQKQVQITFLQDITYYLPRILSIFPYNRNTKTINPNFKVPILISQNKKSGNKKKEYEIEEISEVLRLIGKLLPLLDPQRAEDYHEWIKIGWVIYNSTDGSEEGRELWKKFSEKSEKYSETKCDYLWDRMTKGSYTIGTLKYLAKLDNPDKYQKMIKSDAKNEFKQILSIGTHTHIAKTLHKLYGEDFVCANISKQIWFRFFNHRWEEIESGFYLRNRISDEILGIVEDIKKDEYRKKNETEDDIKKAMHDKRIKCIEKLQCKLNEAPYKENIMKEARYIFYNSEFIAKLDANPNIIAFKNGVYDFIRNEFRPGKPDDFISKTLPINYDKNLTLTDKKVEEVLNFFKQIFPDEELRNYFLDRASEKLQGGNKRKEIYMWVGSGNNGKTVTQKLFDKLLGKLGVKMPTTLITGKKPNVGAAFPEIARLAGVRDATMDEPDPSEKINIGTLKILTGNDSLIGRDLYESGKQMREINPMFKLNFICNALPYFESADKATWNRIRVITFESVFVDPEEAPETEEEQMKQKIFPKDNDFESKIPDMVEALAWYLIYHRIHFKKDNIPEKVRAATQEYRDNNDFVGQFISETYIPCKEGSLSLDEIYPSFKIWYRENMSGTVPTKKNVKESLTKAWGDPINPGCIWKGYKQYTLEEQLKNNDIVILE
jgi:P4 family phage/plasmid primase-like protien